MWEEMSYPWQVAFMEAWEAYCHGSIPIGAVLVNSNGEVVSRGRNRINENSAPTNQICFNKLAHAEVNVLLQVNNRDTNLNTQYTLYTTTEPCIFCFGAIVMSGIRRVRYAAKDPIAGGADLNKSSNKFILSREIDIHCDRRFLGIVQRVIRTDYLLRYISREKSEMLLEREGIYYPEAIELGRAWFETNKLLKSKKEGKGINEIVDEIHKEIGNGIVS
jgi:tRNA(Arg) A34 adenosine deaminase TadA